MQSILVLKLAHEWEATYWHSLRSDDIALIVLYYRTTDSKNRRQEDVWQLIVTLCNSDSFFFRLLRTILPHKMFNFSPTFLRNRKLGLLIFLLSYLLGDTSQTSLSIFLKQFDSFALSISLTLKTTNPFLTITDNGENSWQNHLL